MINNNNKKLTIKRGKKISFALFLVLCFLLAALLSQNLIIKGRDLISGYLEREKQAHERKLQSHMNEVRLAFQEFSWLEDFSKKPHWLSRRDKADIVKDLRDLELKAQNITIDYNDFRYDTTLQIAAKYQLINGVEKINRNFQSKRGLETAAQRFVRGAENTLIFSNYPFYEFGILMKNYEILGRKINR